MNLIRNPKLMLALLVLVAFVLYLSWGEQGLVRAPDKEPGEETPDAFVVDGRYRIFREDGNLSSLLTSEYAVHYPNSNTGNLREPRMQLFQENGRPWHIESRSGHLDFDADQLTLQDQVLVRTQVADQRPWTMTTEWLQLDNQRRFITTDQAVKISSSDAETTALGMDAYVDEKRIILRSQVRGTYAPVTQ